jgi:hypothetical protein
VALGPDDLIFFMPDQSQARRYTVPQVLPDPETLGWTEPNAKGRVYRHGTATACDMATCWCRHCRDAVAAYRAGRRAAGKDSPRRPRTVDTDGHLGRGWFRETVWVKTLDSAELGFHVTPHGLRHAHASWLLAGGADLQVVKERLGHASITTTEKYPPLPCPTPTTLPWTPWTGSVLLPPLPRPPPPRQPPPRRPRRQE